MGERQCVKRLVPSKTNLTNTELWNIFFSSMASDNIVYCFSFYFDFLLVTFRRFVDWLKRNSEDEVMKGKPEAYCSVCQTALRAHYNDLVNHSKTAKHKGNAAKYNRRTQPTIPYGTRFLDFTNNNIHLHVSVCNSNMCSDVRCRN